MFEMRYERERGEGELTSRVHRTNKDLACDEPRSVVFCTVVCAKAYQHHHHLYLHGGKRVWNIETELMWMMNFHPSRRTAS